jgi:hypothetical protein
MIIRYGGREYPLKNLRFTLPELAAVQRHTGLTSTEFDSGIRDPQGNALALMGLLWLARRRTGDFVKWAAFEASLTEPFDTVEYEQVEEKSAEDAATATDSVTA